MPPYVIALIPIVIVVLTAVVVILRGRSHAGRAKPLREASAVVLLDANEWEACSVDDAREPWARYTTEPIRGFCGVPAGRHRVTATVATGEAVLDFVVYPGEVLSFRLDTEHARWEPHDIDVETRALLEGAPISVADPSVAARPKYPGWLVHLRTTMHIVNSRVHVTTVRPQEEGVDRVRKRVAKLVARAEAEDAEADLVAGARALGEALVGKPLTRADLRAVVTPARDAASRALTHGDPDRAMRLLGIGLAVLPGDPELMVLTGCVLAERGDADEALRVLNAALERDRCLDAEDVARAMRVRMELRSRLGRSVRV